MRVRVLFFGFVRDIVGRAAEDAELPPGATAGTLFDDYARRYPLLAPLVTDLVIAKNRAFVRPSEPLTEGDEVALLPPVSGGRPEPAEIVGPGRYFLLTYSPLRPECISRRLLTGTEGAVVTFEGTTRNQSGGRLTRYLDYQGYEAMALKALSELGNAVVAAHSLTAIAIAHRLGRVLIGERSVVIMASAPHRSAAFRATEEAIDRLKKTVPIWKRETFVDGAVWVQGEWDDSVPRIA